MKEARGEEREGRKRRKGGEGKPRRTEVESQPRYFGKGAGDA